MVEAVHSASLSHIILARIVELINWNLSKVITKHEIHIFFHIIRYGIDIHLFLLSFRVFICVFLNNSSNLLQYKMTIVTS